MLYIKGACLAIINLVFAVGFFVAFKQSKKWFYEKSGLDAIFMLPKPLGYYLFKILLVLGIVGMIFGAYILGYYNPSHGVDSWKVW